MISRALGKSAVPGGPSRRSVLASAAYRSGQKLFDASLGRWFEYDKPDVVYTEIVAPGDNPPAWVFDRQTLWNQVERSEVRVDAQLAREIEITLPRELSLDQQVELVKTFVTDQFVARGMVVDFAIHHPLGADGLVQPHAHILTCMRRIDAASPTGFSATKAREWNEDPQVAEAVAEARKRFNRTGAPEDKDALDAAEAQRNVNLWRKAWADAANLRLEAAGKAARIDHRTLAAQGILREPQRPLGLARHVERAYDYLKARVTHWVGVKKRAALYVEAESYKRRDPAKLADFVLRLTDIAESFAAQFKKTDAPIPEVDLER